MNAWDLFDAMGNIADDLRLRALEQPPSARGTWLLHAGKAAVILPLLAVNVLLLFSLHNLNPDGLAPEDDPPETHIIEQTVTGGYAENSGKYLYVELTRTETDDGAYTLSLYARDRTDKIHGIHLTAALYAGDTLLQTVCETDGADTGNYYYCNAAGTFSPKKLPETYSVVCTAECRAAAGADAPVIEIVRLTEVLP